MTIEECVDFGCLRSLDSGRSVRPFQDFLQFLQIVVGEDPDLRAAEPGGVHDAGVDEFVQDDDVVPPSSAQIVPMAAA